MKAIILCAGYGTRIKNFHKIPKALIEIDKKLLIEHSLDKLDGFVDEVFIVVGDMGGMFKQKLGSKYKSIKINCINVSNSRGMAESFYNTKGLINDNVIVLEGDLLYEKRAIENLIKHPNQNSILCSSITGSGDEVYVEIEKPDIVKKIGKDIPKTDIEYIGISKLSAGFFNDCIKIAEIELNKTKYFEEIILEASKNVVVSSCIVKDLIWCDIDTETDYNKATEMYYKLKNVKILLNPAPATTTETVKMSQVVPDICPRETEFCDVMASIRKDLVKIVKGDENYTSVLFSGSGTSVMDATVNSVIKPDSKVLIINNGSYCERFKKICDVYKIKYDELKFDFEIDLNTIKEYLKTYKIDYILAVHHETSSGVINPIEELGKMAKENNAVFIVDAMSSFAGVEIDIKDMNIDFLIASSNKCIQGMAGVGFVICNKIRLNETKSFRRSFYLNLWSQYKYFEETGQMQFTPPVQTIYALRQAIDEYFEEGAENRFNRYKKSHETLIKGLTRLGFKTKGGYILTTVTEPEGFDFQVVHDRLYEKGYTIYPGKTKNTFRLANIGAIDYKDIKMFLIEFEKVLKEVNQ